MKKRESFHEQNLLLYNNYGFNTSYSVQSHYGVYSCANKLDRIKWHTSPQGSSKGKQVLGSVDSLCEE